MSKKIVDVSADKSTRPWTKSEKREAASRSIMDAKIATHRILKDIRQTQARLKF